MRAKGSVMLALLALHTPPEVKEAIVATLTIRNLPDEVRERLRVRAAKAGRSMEAEVRAILTEASLSEQASTSAAALQDWVDRLYGEEKPRHVVEELLSEREAEAAAEAGRTAHSQ